MNLLKNSIKLKVPAKINLSLDIVGRKENGYHLLEMVMQNIGLYDTLSIGAEKADAFSVKITCDRAGIPTDSRNIVYKAAAAFCSALCPVIGNDNYAFTIDIHKEIPDQAGMAGGSADAAGVFVGLNRLFGNPFSTEKLCEIGVKVGADVPYCIHGGTAFVEGIGEVITPLPALTEGFIVGARPKVGISTAAAYHGFDEAHPGTVKLPTSEKTTAILDAVKEKDLVKIGKGLFNVFEDVIDVPEVNEVKELLVENGALGALMTGSGSAVYGIFALQLSAQKAYELLKNVQSDAFFVPLCGNITEVD